MSVRLLEVFARAWDVERCSNHIDAQILGLLQQVPTVLQREAKCHAVLSCLSLSGQLQQQSMWGKKNANISKVTCISKFLLYEIDFSKQFSLRIGVQTGDFGQLCLVFTHKMLDVVLGSVLDVCQLLESTRQNDVFWRHAMFQDQANFSLVTRRKNFQQSLLHHRKITI